MCSIVSVEFEILEELKVKQKLLWVMPVTLGVLLLLLTVNTINSVGSSTSSVEPIQMVSCNSRPTGAMLKAIEVGSTTVLGDIQTISVSEYDLITCECNLQKSMSAPKETVQVGSVSMITNHGEHINTDVIKVEVDDLMNTYYTEHETPVWDDRNKISIIATLWEFLVNQQGMDPKHAAAILGNIMVEGSFAEEQGSYDILDNMEAMRAVLGRGNKGYGVVQWTYHTRQDALLAYYDLAYELYPDDWDKVKVIAECSMLIEEIKAYGVFTDIHEAASLEDSVGRVCVRYERFENCDSAWDIIDGEYTLVSDTGSSDTRYEYAQAIYNYFVK